MAELWTAQDEGALVEAAAAVDPIALLHAIGAARALRALSWHIGAFRALRYRNDTAAGEHLLPAGVWYDQIGLARSALGAIVAGAGDGLSIDATPPSDGVE